MTPKEIKLLRHRMEWTQAQMADYFDVHEATIRRWEQGRNPPAGPAMKLLQWIDRDLKANDQ